MIVAKGNITHNFRCDINNNNNNELDLNFVITTKTLPKEKLISSIEQSWKRIPENQSNMQSH